MKSIVFALVILLITCCSHVYTTSSPVTSSINIDGRWEGKVIPIGSTTPMNVSYDFKKDGDKLTGAADADGVYKKNPIIDGKIKGNKFSFKIKVIFGRMNITDKYTGTFLGEDTLQLTFRSKLGSGEGSANKLRGGESPPNTFTLKRVE